MDAAGVVLVGGRSARMGRAKDGLEWHGSTLLQRTVGVLTRVGLGPIVVVRAPGQALPALPLAVEVVDDPVEGGGPLQGIATGLSALADRAKIAFVCATDLPFLHPELIRLVTDEVTDEVDVALPHARGHHQPLAAAYRTALAPLVTALLADGRRTPADLFERCAVRHLDEAALLRDAALAAADPALDSLVNVNDPAAYRAARARPAPQVTVEVDGMLTAPDGHPVGRLVEQGDHIDPRRATRSVRAADIGAAAAAVGVTFPAERVSATVNGGRGVHDGRVPLVAGDRVAFVPDRGTGAGPMREPLRS
jgi:molybdopterin-guanine dinucleotide biosynthesis protein A